jgi:hypothetical protein
MTTQTFATIDLSSLSLVSGGQAAAPQQEQSDDAPQSRSWGQVAREYGAACVMGAGQSLVYGGRPRNARDAAINAAAGCAMGVGMKAVEDVGGLLAGNR